MMWTAGNISDIFLKGKGKKKKKKKKGGKK